MRWQEASTTGIEAFAAANEELVAGGGAEEVGAVGALGVEAFDDDGLGSEDFVEVLATEDFGAEAFGREGTSAEGFGF